MISPLTYFYYHIHSSITTGFFFSIWVFGWGSIQKIPKKVDIFTKKWGSIQEKPQKQDFWKKVRLYSKVGTRISKSIDLAEISATNEPSYTKFYYPLCYFLPSITSFANYKICHSTTILLTGHELLSFYVALSKYTNILSFFHASEVIQVILIHLVSSDGWTGWGFKQKPSFLT